MFKRTVSGAISLKKFAGYVDSTGVTIAKNQANLYGFYAENDNDYPVFLQFFDIPSPCDIELGVDVPIGVYKIPASGACGKDATDIPLEHFNKSLKIAVTKTRDADSGSEEPDKEAFVQIWYWDIV